MDIFIHFHGKMDKKTPLMLVRMKAVIKTDAVGFDDSSVHIYFPRIRTRADRAHGPPAHR